MVRSARWLVILTAVAGVALLVALGAAQLPAIGAGAVLHPSRRALSTPPPAGCVDGGFPGEGVALRGWRCAAIGPRRATLIYLHGIADNRAGSAGIIDRFASRGFDVIAYDSRAHGESGGDACTYGFFEKADLHRVIDTLLPGPVVLLGQSLGAAVALQEAATDSRISAVVAAEAFSSLRAVVADRAPFVFTPGVIEHAFAVVERQAAIHVDDVNPARAAASITAPVFLIHGGADVDTPARHSQAIYAALPGDKLLRIVAGAHHNESLHGTDIWLDIENWIDTHIVR